MEVVCISEDVLREVPLYVHLHYTHHFGMATLEGEMLLELQARYNSLELTQHTPFSSHVYSWITLPSTWQEMLECVKYYLIME